MRNETQTCLQIWVSYEFRMKGPNRKRLNNKQPEKKKHLAHLYCNF